MMATAPQRTLFEQPISRNTDPVTSFQAHEDLHQSGKWKKQVWRVFFALRDSQGCTSSELARRLDFGDRYTCSRRLGDLRRMGLVCNGAKRQCSVTRKRCLTWWLATRWAEKTGQRAKAKPERPRETPAPSRRERGPVVKVMTLDERREFRRRMLAKADAKTREFLEQFDRGGGGGK